MKSIGFKLWTAMMLLFAVMLVVLWLFQIVFLEKFYMTRQIDKLQTKSIELVETYSESGDFNSIVEAFKSSEALAEFSDTYHINMEVLDSRGLVSYSISSSLQQQGQNMFKKAMSQLFIEVLKGEVVQTTMTHSRLGNTYLLVGIPILSPEISSSQSLESRVIGAVLYNAPMAPVSDTADILKQQLVYISAILLIATVITAFLISRHFSKPILKINKAAQAIAKGRWDDVDLKTDGKDEIGQLAVTITEMAIELKQTDQLRKELIGNVSHELRTPLSLIQGYAETIKDISGNHPVRREEHLDIIIHESKRLSGLIEDILNLSQLEVGVVKLKIEQIDVQMLLNNMLQKFENLATKNNIALVASQDNHFHVSVDLSRIEQVLVNLIGNAFNHTAAGGKIELIAANMPEGIKISIKDNGSGISEDELTSIWERYYKVKDVASEKRIGNGLGLAIVKNILVAHNAKYGVDSVLGLGTTFWFILPENK